DKQGGTGSGLVVHDAAHPRPRGAAYGDDVAAAPQRDGGVGSARGLIERAEDRLEALHQTLARLAHGPAGAGDAVRRAVQHPPRAQRPGGMLGHPLQRGGEFECLQHRRRDATRGGGTHAADSSSRTIWFTTLPSARPLNLGITCPMTLPTSRTPPAIASRTA